ncbi:MAG: hypothetical protein IT452_14625 [Planctomycetia bacterium]|nr:hypothetical protein [Planctomycetia bacterium]
MAKDSPVETILTILFWGIVFLVGAIVNARKKKRQEQEVLETQEQLRRVDEAIQAARQRSGRKPARQAPPEAEVPAAAMPSVSPDFSRERAEGPRNRIAPAPDSFGERAEPAFRPPSESEIRQALVWREIFGPCAAMRS